MVQLLKEKMSVDPALYIHLLKSHSFIYMNIDSGQIHSCFGPNLAKKIVGFCFFKKTTAEEHYRKLTNDRKQVSFELIYLKKKKKILEIKGIQLEPGSTAKTCF